MKEIGSFINIKNEASPNKSGRLKECIRPIRACIGKPEQFDETKPPPYKQILEILSWKVFSQNVNYESDIPN